MTTMSGGINFSNSGSNGFKSNFRKAGDAFTINSGNKSDNSPSSNRAAYETYKMSLGNTGSSSSSSNSSSSSSSSNTTSSTKYDEDKYRYYVGQGGTNTGAEAYGKDMEKYNDMVALNNGDTPAAGHLGLVAKMMHPDFKVHNYNGTYGTINQSSDYSVKPADWENAQKRRDILNEQMKGVS